MYFFKTHKGIHADIQILNTLTTIYFNQALASTMSILAVKKGTLPEQTLEKFYNET